MNKVTIKKIMKAAGVVKGKLVLLHFWGEDSDRAILHEFAQSVAACGASPIELQQSRSVNKAMFSNAEEPFFCDRYYELFKGIDVIFDIFMYQPVTLGERIDDAGMNTYRTHMGRMFGALGEVRTFVQLRVPTEQNAAESGLEPSDYITRMESAYDINYDAMRELCESRIDELKSAEKLTLYTGDNCELHFSLEERSWTGDYGNGDLPCGEVAIAPIEDATEGSIYFKKLFLEDAGCFENVTLRVAGGKIIDADNQDVSSFLAELPENGNVVCELGIGLNTHVVDLCGYTLLDEKMAGTYHIAIGNNTMFGGKNDAPLHIDMVTEGRLG